MMRAIRFILLISIQTMESTVMWQLCCSRCGRLLAQKLILSVESGVYYDQLDQGDFEICRYGYSAEDSPIQFLEMWTTGMQVVPAVNDEKFDQMIEDARQISDRSEYMKALHEAEDYLVEENVYVIPLFNFNDPALVQTYVEGQTMNGIYPYFAYATVTE